MPPSPSDSGESTWEQPAAENGWLAHHDTKYGRTYWVKEGDESGDTASWDAVRPDSFPFPLLSYRAPLGDNAGTRVSARLFGGMLACGLSWGWPGAGAAN